eukprot:gnl/Trimastix_PCT/2824.p1 GENE.gnl/Trimastix_PCT/2824~~gnl/Trimastix_PCT/2824.p1  ORF type:complete len:869 (+),score=281.60 gnl/Trimastix_PCT/2824:77-2683(+)
MFWKRFVATDNSIKTKLKRSQPLSEIIEDEEFLQELKSGNAQLIAYLRKPATVLQLVDLLIGEPPEGASDIRRYKYPYVAAEVLGDDTIPVLEVLIKNFEVRDRLFSFLDGEAPLNSLLAGYFSKVVAVLANKHPEAVIYINEHGIVAKIFKHIECYPFIELAYRLFEALENIISRAQIAEMIQRDGIIPGLIRRLSVEEPQEVHFNAAAFLCDIITRLSAPVSYVMTSTAADLDFNQLVTNLLDLSSCFLEPPPQTAVLDQMVGQVFASTSLFGEPEGAQGGAEARREATHGTEGDSQAAQGPQGEQGSKESVPDQEEVGPHNLARPGAAAVPTPAGFGHITEFNELIAKRQSVFGATAMVLHEVITRTCCDGVPMITGSQATIDTLMEPSLGDLCPATFDDPTGERFLGSKTCLPDTRRASVTSADNGLGDTDDPQQIPYVMSSVLDHLQQLVDILKTALPTPPHCVTQHSLGIHRVRFICFFNTLLKTRFPQVMQEVLKTDIVEVLLSLFLAYPNANALHEQVHSFLMQILQHTDHPTRMGLIRHPLLLETCLRVWARNCPACQECDAEEKLVEAPVEGQEKPKVRGPKQGKRDQTLGYVLLLANALTDLAADHPDISEVLNANDEWKRFVSEELNRQNELQKALLGGSAPPQPPNLSNAGLVSASPMNPFESYDPQQDLFEMEYDTFDGYYDEDEGSEPMTGVAGMRLTRTTGGHLGALEGDANATGTAGGARAAAPREDDSLDEDDDEDDFQIHWDRSAGKTQIPFDLMHAGDGDYSSDEDTDGDDDELIVHHDIVQPGIPVCEIHATMVPNDEPAQPCAIHETMESNVVPATEGTTPAAEVLPSDGESKASAQSPSDEEPSN